MPTTYRRYQPTSPCFCRRTCRSGFPRQLTTSATWLMPATRRTMGDGAAVVVKVLIYAYATGTLQNATSRRTVCQFRCPSWRGSELSVQRPRSTPDPTRRAPSPSRAGMVSSGIRGTSLQAQIAGAREEGGGGGRLRARISRPVATQGEAPGLARRSRPPAFSPMPQRARRMSTGREPGRPPIPGTCGPHALQARASPRR